MYVKKIFGILLHAIVKMEKIQQVMDDSAIMCDEIRNAEVDAKAKSNKESNLNDYEMKTNFNEKKVAIFLQHYSQLLVFTVI